MTERSKSFSFLIALLLAFICEQPARAQAVSATLLGTVTDSTGALVPGAGITVTEVNTGVSRTASTTSAGVYTIPYLSPGRYKVEIAAAGFKKFIRENIELTVAASVRVDASLELGVVSDSVQVTGESPLLQTDRAEIARTYDTQAVRELPFAERTPQALVALSAGVIGLSTATADMEGPWGTTTWRTNGQSNQANNSQVDGVDDNDRLVNKTIYLPPDEAVEEVYISTSNYNAEFGSAGGTVMNIVTRGGTNKLHGSLFEFHRDANLAARSAFNVAPLPKPGFIRNEFGGSVGGPIKKDKTFFFASYQSRHLVQGSFSTNSVPTPAWLTGDFSATPGLHLYDPTTGNADGTGRSPFPNNVIPLGRFNPVAQKLIALFPRPTASAFVNNYGLNVPFHLSGNSYDGRVDHHISDKTKVFFKFNTSRWNATQDAVLGPVIGNGSRSFSYTLTGIVNLTHGFSPTLLTELRLGYNRYYAHVENQDTDPLNKQFGIQNPNPDPISEQTGLASISISGMAAIGGQVYYPLINVNNIFNLVDSWNKIISKHTIKWGGEVRRYRMDRFQPQGLNLGPRGLFVFQPGPTALNGGPALGSYGTFGNSFAGFLLGTPNQTSRTYMPITPTNRTTNFFAFVNDTYQVASRVTLDLGLRYELYTTVKPRYAGGASNYDPATNALLVAGVGGVGMSTGVEVQLTNFQPRFGLSYRFNDKTVVRLGAGVSNFIGQTGFTGGTLSCQFPVIYNVQVGTAGDYRVSGSLNSLPVVPLMAIPSNGIISPAPDQAFFNIPSHNPIPRVYSWSFTIQRAIGGGFTWDVGYVGNIGRNLPEGIGLNTAPPGTGAAGRLLYQKFGRTANTISRAYAVSNSYNSLQTSLRRRFSHGLMLTAAYTFGKALGYGGDQAGGGQSGYMNNLDRSKNHGPLSYDRSHAFVASHVYELPLGRGKRFLRSGGPVGYILGNWQLNGIIQLATGTPFNVTADSTACNCPGNSVTADILKPVRYLKGTGPGQLWFDITSFGQPGSNRFGTAGVYMVRAPGTHIYNMSIFKLFPVKERARIEFRTEFYNLTNTPQWGGPSGNFNSGSFGQITSAGGQRNIQFALRIVF
jgi:hypothetical protein